MNDTVKLKILGHKEHSDASYSEDKIYNIAKKHFNIEISDNPDFIITGASYGKQFEYANYDCPRIFLGYGENTPPDFSSFDYIFGFDDCILGDRYCRYFLFMNWFGRFTLDELKKFNNVLFDKPIEKDRKYFCDFIYSHQSSHGVREELLKELDSYKTVACAGSFKNNMPNGFRCKNYDEKYEFQKQCKFSIACESVKQYGFTTEKILQPFRAGSIPIYYGNPEIETIFNRKAFINVNSFPSVAEAVEYVKYIDTHEDAYLRMCSEPIFVDPLLPYKMLKAYEDQVVHILSQKKEEAYRRPIYYTGAKPDLARLQYYEMTESITYKYWRKFRKLLHVLGISDKYKSVF